MIGMKYQCTICNKYHESISEAIDCKEECLKNKDSRNVIDVYKYWKTEAIRADLDQKRHNFSVLITNQFHD
jgi:hypothetical protein